MNLISSLTIGAAVACAAEAVKGLHCAAMNFANYKTGRDRIIPMNSTIRETFTAIGQQAQGDQVFPINDVKRSFAYACVKAKIADFHFHDCRHTAATRLAERGADAFQIAAILGHSSIQMTARYTHATSDGLRRVMESLAENNKQWG